MVAVASGCITIWEGGSLWAFHVPAVNEAPPRTDQHAHHAIQLTVAIGGEFIIELPEGRLLPGPAVLIAADGPHALQARGDVAVLFVEPESPAGRAVSRLLPHGAGATALTAPLSGELLARMRGALHASVPDRDALQAAGRELVGELVRRAVGEAHALEGAPDPRVLRMIDWANAHLADGVSIEAAARSVDLSPSRASHLFVQHTGLAFRTWLLWLRAMRAVERYAAGGSLTEAAHEAGFADSPHLSRTFRRLFGLPAAVLTLR